MSRFAINLHEAVYSLSDALDLVGVTHIHHGKRVAYIAAEIGRCLDWPQERMDTLFQAAILHDSGVSKTQVHSRLAQLEWEYEAEHCERGAELVNASPLLRPLSDCIRYHHTHWMDLKSLSLSEETKLIANCIYLADRVDVQCLTRRGEEPNILLIKDHVREQVVQARGDWYEPSLVDAFMAVSSSEAFWFALENEHVSGYVHTWMRAAQTVEIEFADLRSLVHVFSCIVDAKSTFTREHSDGVANLARHIGGLYGLPERTCDMLELAGLLHDLGKLRVPDELLEKPGKLDPLEYSAVQRHSFDTYNILKNIHGFEDIALWAGQHHERVNGTGYPYHLRDTQLSREARIVAVADVFQALAQNRPYRGALAPEAIAKILQEEVVRGKLDGGVVQMVLNNLQACWEASLAYSSLESPL